MLGASWETTLPYHGARSTHNTGEYPNAAVESTLSQILEDNPHPEILFECPCVPWDFTESRIKGQGIAKNAEGCTGNAAQGGQRQTCVGFSFQRSDELKESEVASTQSARQYKSATDLVVASVDCRNGTAYTANQFANYTDGVGTLRANGGDLGGGSESLIVNQSVRKLTPLECERLQGYPDGYSNIPGASDSARYKALGNSFAIPNIYFVISKIKEVYNNGTE